MRLSLLTVTLQSHKLAPSDFLSGPVVKTLEFPNAGGPGLIPHQQTRSYMPQQRGGTAK